MTRNFFNQNNKYRLNLFFIVLILLIINSIYIIQLLDRPIINAYAVSNSNTSVVLMNNSKNNIKELSDNIDFDMSSTSIENGFIKVDLKQKESKRQTIRLKNKRNSASDITIRIYGVSKFINLSEDSFRLNSSSSKEIYLDFFAKPDVSPELYLGNIMFSADSLSKTFYIVVIVEPKMQVLEFVSKLNKRTNKILSSEGVNISFEIRLLEDKTQIPTSLYYAISDLDGKILSNKKEDLLIDKNVILNRFLEIPANQMIGDYLLTARLNYGNESMVSTNSFEIIESYTYQDPFYYQSSFKYTIIGVLIFSLICIYLIYRRFINQGLKPQKIDIFKRRVRRFLKKR